MRREVTRERKLMPFSIDVAALEALLRRLVGLFGEIRPATSISLTLGTETLSYDSTEELRAYPQLPERASSFRVHLYAAGGRSITIRAPGWFGGFAEIEAGAEDEAWCAGAVEVAYQFLRPFRLRCAWFRGWPLGACLLLVLNIPTLLLSLGYRHLVVSTATYIAWLFAAAALLALYVFRRRLLPVAVLRFTARENVFRRYMPELTLAMAVIALLLTILGWFLHK